MYYVVGMSPFAQKEQNIEDIFLQKKKPFILIQDSCFK